MKWQSYKLKEVGEVVTGNTPPTTQREYYGTQYKFIKPTDMREGQRYVPITEEYYSELAYQKYRKSLLPVNTPCVVTIGSLGKKMCLTDEPSFTNQAVNAVIPNENFDGVFLYYCLRTRLPYVKQLDSGTTSGRENVSKSSFSNIVIEAPSLAIQKRIASILSAYDNLIENNNKRIKILEQMAENLYKEWFVRFRFPGHETTPLENGIPKGWKLRPLFDVASVTYGFPFKSELFNNEESSNAVVRIRDILDNKTDTYTSESCDNHYLIRENAILIGMDGLFHMCLWNGSRAFLNQRVVMLNSKDDNICNYLLYLSVKPQIKFWEQAISGTTVAHLGDKHLKKVTVLIPNQPILKEANERFRAYMEQKRKLFIMNQNLIKQRDLLLPRLMSGKLAV
jgi:type I restriction enzyme S subunit